MMEKINTAIYCRVSSVKQLDGYGLDVQESKCRDYFSLMEFEGEPILYIDDGYSAKNLKRPMITKLINDVKEGLIKRVIIYKLDRISRNVVDIYKLLDIFTKFGCSLIAVMDHLDITSANGIMIIGILSVIGNFESRVTSQRTIDSLEAVLRVKKCYPFKGVPYGFNKDKEHKLTINKEQAIIINEAIDYYLNGASYVQVSHFFNEKAGLKVKDWRSIKKLLSREYNIGQITYRGITYTDVFPQIVDYEKHNRVLEAMRHRQINEPEKEKYLFHDLVFCCCGCKCEHSSTIREKNRTKRKYFYYVCPVCKKRVNQQDILNDISLNLCLNILKSHNEKEFFEETKKLDGINNKIYELSQTYMNDIINSECYYSALTQLEEEKKKIEMTIRKIGVTNVKGFYLLSDIEKNVLIKEYIKKIIFDFSTMCVVSIEYNN